MNYAIASPNSYSRISGLSSKDELVDALASKFVAVGWVASAISYGYRLLGTSPQGFQVYLDIWQDHTDYLHPPVVALQLHSAVGSAVGYEYHLGWDPSFSWQIAVHPCGFAISRPGVLGDSNGSAIMGGIPKIADSCGLTAAQGSVTEVWYSLGDYAGSVGLVYAPNPRVNLDRGEGATLGNQTGCFNGVLFPFSPNGGWSMPQVLRQSSAATDGHPQGGGVSSHTLWYGDTDMLYPALIAWGTGNGTPVLVRGQIYNAAVRTMPWPMDATADWDGYRWINYTDSYFWGSLWFLRSTGPASLTANYAY